MLATEYKKIVVFVLDLLDLKSEAAINLMLGTPAKESHMCKWIRQQGLSMQSNVGGFGPNQMELPTDKDIWINVINDRARFHDVMTGLIAPALSKKQNLASNFAYSIGMARLQYWRFDEPLPEDPNDIAGLGSYWDRYYNKNPEKGTVQEFVNCYNRYALMS